MSASRGISRLAGLGLGLAAASITAAAGVAAERLSRERRTAIALDEQAGTTERLYDDPADEEPICVATDGVPLHVEVDLPDPDAPPPAPGVVRPTIVLSHGYCLSMRCWVFQRRALTAAGYKVVLWDQRGHGDSGAGDADYYSIDQLGEDLAKVIEVGAPEGPLVLVGHSMGGMTMMDLAMRHAALIRERVIGAAFVSTSPGRLGDMSFGLVGPLARVVRTVTPAATLRLATQQGLVDTTVKAGRDVVDFFVNWGSFGHPVPLSIAQLTTDMIFGTRMDVIASFMPRFAALDKTEALAAYQGIEVLVLNGTADRLTPPEHSDDIVRLLPGAEHVVVSDAGHIIMLEYPEIVTEQILDLVRRAEKAELEHQREVGRSGPRARRTGSTRVPRRVTDMADRKRTAAARESARKPKRTRRKTAPSEDA